MYSSECCCVKNHEKIIKTRLIVHIWERQKTCIENLRFTGTWMKSILKIVVTWISLCIGGQQIILFYWLVFKISANITLLTQDSEYLQQETCIISDIAFQYSFISSQIMSMRSTWIFLNEGDHHDQLLYKKHSCL